MSGEDLQNLPVVPLHQDFCTLGILNLDHSERNGHHYVNGMEGVGQSEQRAFLRAHGDLYHDAGGITRLTIAGGQIALGSLDTPGLGSAVIPDFAALRAVALAG